MKVCQWGFTHTWNCHRLHSTAGLNVELGKWGHRPWGRHTTRGRHYSQSSGVLLNTVLRDEEGIAWVLESPLHSEAFGPTCERLELDFGALVEWLWSLCRELSLGGFDVQQQEWTWQEGVCGEACADMDTLCPALTKQAGPSWYVRPEEAAPWWRISTAKDTCVVCPERRFKEGVFFLWFCGVYVNHIEEHGRSWVHHQIPFLRWGTPLSTSWYFLREPLTGSAWTARRSICSPYWQVRPCTAVVRYRLLSRWHTHWNLL